MLVNIHKLKIIVVLFLFGFNHAYTQIWTLQQCIDTAHLYNKNLQINRNNISIVNQKAQEAKANLIPKLSVNADYKYFTNLPYQFLPLSTFNSAAPEGQYKEAQFGVPHNITANLQLSMPLYNPQIYGGIQTSKIAEELTVLKSQKSDEQLYFDISNIYYNAQILSTQLSFLDSNLVNSNKLLSNMNLLKEQSMVKGTDVSKVQLQVDQLTTQKLIVKSKYEQVLNGLKFAMGISQNQKIEIDPTIEIQNSIEYSPTSTLDMRLAKTQNRFISSELSTLKKSRLPSLFLFGNYGYSGFGYDKQPNSFLKFYPVGFGGVQLTYPLFNGTITQKKINQKKLELQNSELQEALIMEQNAMLIYNARMQIEATQKTVETTLKQIKLAQTIYTQTISQQKQGIASLSEVLLADNSLREAQQTNLNAIIEYLRADLDLKKLSGNISTFKN